VQVRGGKAERPTAAVTDDDATPESVRPAEKPPRPAHVPRGDEGAKPRAAHALAVARRGDRPDHVDAEAEAGAERPQRRRGAGPPATEVDVVADDCMRQVEMPQHEVVDERLGIERREGQREALQNGHIDTELAQAREAVVQRLDHRRRALRGEHRDRMRLEGERHRPGAELPRPRHRRLHDRLMAEVRAVEVAEGQNAARQPLGQTREVPDDSHRPPVIYRTARDH
jgi:hypothetical protein